MNNFGPTLYLKTKYFGPNKIVWVKGGDIDDVATEEYHEGHKCLITCAECVISLTKISQWLGI